MEKKKLRYQRNNVDRRWYLVHSYGIHPQLIRENWISWTLRRMLLKLRKLLFNKE